MSLHNNRVVIKVGTSTLTYPKEKSNLNSFAKIADTLSDIQKKGYEIIVVSSGAVAIGKHKLKNERNYNNLRLKQAFVAVGQCRIMYLYDLFLKKHGITAAQILLNAEDVANQQKRENLIKTFNTLLKMNIIPIVNENDSVGYTEIESKEKVFGDNDILSAVVAVLCKAGRLIILSDVDVFYDKDPHLWEDAKLIRKVTKIDKNVMQAAGGASFGTGGMRTKLKAAKLAVSKGINTVQMVNHLIFFIKF